MKNILLTIIIFLSCSAYAFCIEEVSLKLSDDEKISRDTIKLKAEYISDVYYGKNEQKAPVLLELFSKDGLQINNSVINSVKAEVFYSQTLNDTIEEGGRKTFTNSFGAADTGVKVKFNDKKSEFFASYNITRFLADYDNDFSEKISCLYVAHNINDHQKIMIGQGGRLPSSYDGGVGLFAAETINRSQIASKTGNARSFGIRNIAEYKYVDYDTGVYDSARYFNDFGHGSDFTGHVFVKPFGIKDESKTNFKFGGGYNTGKHHTNYNVYSLYAGYDYKKFHIHTEYINADGYHGMAQSQNKAEGLYAYSSYDITPKIALIGKFDTYTPDKTSSNHYINEYTAGITYKAFKNMKFLVNYIKHTDSRGKNFDMILFATRFII